MRTPVWLILVSGAALSLAGCGDPVAAGKPGKTAASSGRQEVTLRLAHATEAAGDYPGAEKLFLQSATQNPDASDAHLELANFYKRHHQDQKAIESLITASKLQPNNADIERTLANTYINAAEPEKAIAVLDTAIAANSRNPLLYNSKGVALDQIGSYGEAQNSYKKAFEIDPAEGTMYKINLSMSYILEGTYDKAIELLRPMLDSPDAPPIARQNLALAYGLKGESENALKLGLQDLSTSEAEENVKFYRMFAQRHGLRSQKTPGASTVPASVVKELFPEEEPQPAAVAAPVSPVVVHEEVVPIIVSPPTVTPVSSPPAAVPVSKMTLPEPVVKKTVEIPSPVKATVQDNEEEAAPPPPVMHVTPVSSSPAATPVSKMAPPEPVVKKAVEIPSPVKATVQDDEEEATPPPPVMHKEAVPIPTLSVSPAASPSPQATMTVAPDETPLPEPVLKPDNY